jgi:hypothetical protein
VRGDGGGTCVAPAHSARRAVAADGLAVLLTIFLFVCVGIAMEVAFTAITDFWRDRCPRLRGHSYLWMAFTYAAVPLILAVVYPPIHQLPIAARLALYVSLVYLVEYSWGWLLRRATGQCPWDYGRARWAVSGLIRLDYLPCWAAACWMFERLFVALHSHLG